VRKLLYVLLGVLFIFSCGDDTLAVDDLVCGENLYIDSMFEQIGITEGIVYGNNFNVDGTPIELLMDVYEPIEHIATNRPVIIWAFGGAFVSGDRSQMDAFARSYARKGYVTATIDYRILGFQVGIPDSIQALDIAVKASSDMKAAIRHLRKDAATGNNFGIDPNQIIVAGVSSGAITALQVAMVDEDDPLSPAFFELIEQNGGFEGSSGDEENMSYSSAVQGVISLSGGIANTEWIDSNDPPIFSFHGDDDQVVPYGFDAVRILGSPIINLFGSQEIHKKAEAIGLSAQLITVVGGGHQDIYIDEAFSSIRDELDAASALFFSEQICR